MWIAASSPTIIINPPSGYGLQTLGAVLLGAVITGGFALLVARYRERKAAAAEAARHAVEVRRAARLIDDDLHTAVNLARYSIENKEWWGSLERLTSTAWKEYRGVLAPDLADNDWRSVSLAFRSIDLFQSVRDKSANSHLMTMAIDPNTAAMVAPGIAYDVMVIEPVPMTDALADRVRDILLVALELGRAALAPLMRERPT
jgi:hypothetical protein